MMSISSWTRGDWRRASPTSSATVMLEKKLVRHQSPQYIRSRLREVSWKASLPSTRHLPRGSIRLPPMMESSVDLPAPLAPLTIHDRALSEPKLVDVSCTFPKGSRVLVSGANGAGKSTLLSIMGGKRMLPRGRCLLLGKEAFHDTSLNRERMYCGDWWRTNFFFNITVAELIGESRLTSARVQELIDIMQINLSWRINAISDGQRRRCQLLECLAEEKKVYVLDEITTDLDLYAREGLLDFLKRETETKGATVFYATHIFDSLATWATHCLHFTKAKVAKCCKMEDLKEYHDRVANGTRCPLYSVMKEWIFREYPAPPVLDHVAEAPMAPTPE